MSDTARKHHEACKRCDELEALVHRLQQDAALARRLHTLEQANDSVDTLTGLPNRPSFVEHLEQAMDRARGTNAYLFSVLFIDLDRFKFVNDSLGHAHGDRLLVEFAERLRHAVRGGDVVARLSGDEFAVLADDLSELGDALRLAGRIEEGLRSPFELDGQSVFVSASIGIARNAARYTTGAELLRDADIAMYRAKESGGDGHRMFDTDMHKTMVSRMQIETDLRQAVGTGQLRVHYQPIIDLKSGELHGFEALLRWRHPQRGMVMPGEFIPIAEETGLIVPIGRWVRREVCRRLRTLNRGRKRKLSVSVNLADREFSQPALVDDLARLLEETRTPPECLHLELTERMLMSHTRMEAEQLPRLRALGMTLMIDDFGTGYSSLGRLQRLPIDSLKIDYSFVRNLAVNEDSATIVQTIIALAHNLGIAVVAEGVENPEQLLLLQGLGCEYAQGFYFSPAVEERKLSALVERTDWLSPG